MSDPSEDAQKHGKDEAAFSPFAAHSLFPWKEVKKACEVQREPSDSYRRIYISQNINIVARILPAQSGRGVSLHNVPSPPYVKLTTPTLYIHAMFIA